MAIADMGDTIYSFKNLRRQMAASLDGSELKNQTIQKLLVGASNPAKLSFLLQNFKNSSPNKSQNSPQKYGDSPNHSSKPSNNVINEGPCEQCLALQNANSNGSTADVKNTTQYQQYMMHKQYMITMSKKKGSNYK